MNRAELQEHISEIREKLNEILPTYFNHAIETISITREQMKKLAKEFEIEMNAQFKEKLKSKFIELIFNLQKQHWLVKSYRYPPLNVEELINTSFFPSADLPVLQRHPPLAQFILIINQKISEFYEIQKKLIQFILQEQKKVDQYERNKIDQKQTQEIVQNQAQTEIKRKKSSDSLIEINQEPELNQFYEAQKNKRNLKQQRQLEEQLQNNLLLNPIQQEKETQIDLIKLSNCADPTEAALQCQFCLCYKLSLTKVNGQMIKCIVCKNYFHTKCFQIENKIPKIFACPECIIPRLDPMREVEDVLLLPQYLNMRQNYNKMFDLQPSDFQSTDEFEMRCIKIDGDNQEMSWPDCGELKVNGTSIKSFQPLQSNSSLKKRKDDSQPLQLLQNARNQVQLQEGFPTKDQMQEFRIKLGLTYLIAIFKVRDRTYQEFLDRIKRSSVNWMGIDQCKKMIKLSIMTNQNEDFAMEKIKVSLNDVLNMSLIETPARGSFCLHIQCFSLENLCTMMKNMTHRKWRCPICKSLILDIVIDSYQLSLLTLIKQYNLNIEEISFNVEAQIEHEQLSALYKSKFQNHLPSYIYTNNNRSIAMEILSQRILGINNVYGSQEVDIKPSQKKKRNTQNNPVLPLQKSGTEAQPICLD